MRLWYLSHRRPAKAQASLRIRGVSPEPSLFAHIKYGSRRRLRPKIRHLAPLDGCACAFEEWDYDKWTDSMLSITSTLFARSFRRRFFAYHYAVNHPHANIIWSWVSIPLVLNCASKILKIGLQIKLLMSKNVFEWGFCIGKGDNPNIFDFRFWQICQLYSNVWTPGLLSNKFLIKFYNF